MYSTLQPLTSSSARRRGKAFRVSPTQYPMFAISSHGSLPMYNRPNTPPHHHLLAPHHHRQPLPPPMAAEAVYLFLRILQSLSLNPSLALPSYLRATIDLSSFLGLPFILSCIPFFWAAISHILVTAFHPIAAAVVDIILCG